MKNDEIALQTWWMGELSAITKKLMSQEEKRQQKAAISADKLMGDYRTLADIQDAYGMGMITEKKYERLMDLYEDRNRTKASSALYQMKMSLLQELYQDAKQVLQDLTSNQTF